MPTARGSAALKGVTGRDRGTAAPTDRVRKAGCLNTRAGTAAGAGAWKAVCHQRRKGFHKTVTMVNLQSEVQQD
jgi:hypothetical protein